MSYTKPRTALVAWLRLRLPPMPEQPMESILLHAESIADGWTQKVNGAGDWTVERYKHEGQRDQDPETFNVQRGTDRGTSVVATIDRAHAEAVAKILNGFDARW